MKARVVLTAMAATAVLCTSPVVYAAPAVGLRVPVQAIFSHTKLVNLNLRNDSATAVKVKAGDQRVTVEPGKTVSLKLEPGTQVVAEEATTKYAAGTVLTVATPGLSNAVVVLR
jgi:hypothetical protein